ncbi:hypothetical protein AURDEDRAFT_177001 [Auricularia subglabra TFB-10046 SS5]|uniref:F-box domain-containing protein n=1 Tax=Auricularia subglabra (strain TFB-10046 / SS5) TaxID=717982 RepID=J0WNK7_AURST|nr:hypothetical protein AURDEDRAFT_177001 [Auricularia subglabra TFB-10046 SS5]
MECTSTVVDLLNDARARTLLRYASFHNQWEALFPLHTAIYAAEPLDNEVFGELFAAIAWLLFFTRLRHLRLSGVGLPRRLIPHISRHVTLERLTLESCILEPIMIGSLHPRLQMPNITSLTIGFGGTPRSNSMECWSVVLYCVNLRQLFVYPVEDNSIVHYPSSSLFDGMSHLHYLQKLHIQGGSSLLRPLASWIRHSGDKHARLSHGHLTHFKLNTVIGTTDDELSILLDALSTFHPNVRVLVLEGIVDTAPAVTRIAYEFPQLEGLTIVRKVDMFQKTVRLCQWDMPSYAIAQVLAALPRLQHFAANLDYTRLTFGPAAFNALAYPALDSVAHIRSAYADSIDAILYEHLFSPSRVKTAEEKATCLALIEKRDCYDSLLDGPSIARPFAVYCNSLTSFAIKTDRTAFSCHIRRDTHGNAVLYDVVDKDVAGGFEAWNPLHFETWMHLD